MKQTKDVTIKQKNELLMPGQKSTAMRIIHLTTPVGTKVFKFSYDTGNAYEHFKGEIFDGDKLNTVFILTDLGVHRNTSAYLLFDERELKERIGDLMDRGVQFIKNLY
jgi:hypothetical protein